ncbi:MAG TPA: S8 family serine peptidase [Haliscomenobacter sp.]|nr:S8 family serine peptidase [Haliscomenobacter sp.]
MQTYTYRNGKKLLLNKSDDEFVTRETPEELIARGITQVEKTSPVSSKVKTTPEGLEADMAKSRESAPTHHAYYLADTGDEFLITDRVTISFKTAISSEDLAAFMGKYGLVLLEEYSPQDFLFQLTEHTGMNPIKLVVKLTEEEPGIAFAENDTNYRVKRYAIALPTDPIYARQWHLQTRFTNVDFDPRSSSNCEEAWKLLDNFGSPEVVIGITDDGCKVDHPDFSGDKFKGWGYFRGSRLVKNTDIDAVAAEMYIAGSDHGTACAGVAAGNANGQLVVGAAPGCKLLPVQWQSDGPYLLISDSKLLTALTYMADKVDVLSNSWGGTPTSIWQTLVVNRLRDLAKTGGRRGKGIVFLWAAGNENCPINHEANVEVPYTDGWSFSNNQWRWVGVETSRSFQNNLVGIPGVLHVAALASTAQRSHYSNYGAGIEITASSNNVHSYSRIRLRGLGISTASGESTGFTNSFGGTSSATPLTAGIVALIVSAKPDLSGAEVISILKKSASKDLNLTDYPRTPPASYDPNPTWDISPVAPFNKGEFKNINSTDGTWSPWFGHGKADAQAAVKMAIGNVPPPPPPPEPQKAIRIVSALVNPVGFDTGKENITLLNPNAVLADLNGWTLDVNNRKQSLNMILNPGEAKTFNVDPSKVVLTNTGGTIKLIDKDQKLVAQVKYLKKEVKNGIVVEF